MASLFSSALKKKQEAANKWKENNDLAFNENNYPNYSTSSSSSSSSSGNSATRKSIIPKLFSDENENDQKSPTVTSPTKRQQPYRSPNSKPAVVSSSSSNSFDPVSSSSSSSATNGVSDTNSDAAFEDLLGDLRDSSSPFVSSTNHNPHPSFSTTPLLLTDSASSHPPLSSIHDFASFKTFLSSFFTSFTALEMLALVLFTTFLLYFHFSFYSFVDLFDIDYSAIVSSFLAMTYAMIKELLVSFSLLFTDPSSSLFAAWFQQLRKWYFTSFSIFDTMMIIGLTSYFTIVYDCNKEKTDEKVLEILTHIRDHVNMHYEQLQSLYERALTYSQTIRGSIMEGYYSYERKTPRIVRIGVLLLLFSFFLRYMLFSFLSFVSYMLITCILPLKAYFISIFLLAFGMVSSYYYLQRQQAKKKSIVKVAEAVKALLKEKDDQQYPIEYCYTELNERLTNALDGEVILGETKPVKTDESSDERKKKAGGWLWTFLKHVFQSSSNSDKKEETKANQSCSTSSSFFSSSSSSSVMFLRKDDLNGFSLSSLWNETIKEVNKDKRIKSFLMFWQGRQLKCWKLMN
jgi:hypothetical protein